MPSPFRLYPVAYYHSPQDARAFVRLSPSFIEKSIYISCAKRSVLTTAHLSGLICSPK